MELTGDHYIEMYAEQCMHCTRNTIVPYEYEWICISNG